MRSLLIAAVVLATLAGVLGAGLAEEGEASNTLQRARDLVEQLGSPRYTEREAAAKQLANLGEEARAVLEEGLRVPEAETRLRVQRILARIEEDGLQRRIDAFLAGTQAQGEPDLPAWPRFRELIGDSPDARQMFVGMLKAEGDLLAAVASNPRGAAGMFRLRCQQLRVESAAQAREIDEATLAAVLFVAADARVPLTPGTDSLLYRFCSHSGVEKALVHKGDDSIMRRIVGSWVASGRGGYYSLHLAMRHELPEGLSAAEKMLDNNTPVYYRQYAILAFAKLGDASHIPRLVTLLADATVCTTRRVNNETLQTQFRDVVLVAVLHLAGHDPKRYGFDRIRAHPQCVYSPHTLGFKSEAERGDAFAKWEKVKAKLKLDPASEPGG